MSHLLDAFNLFVLGYFLLLNLTYFTLTLTAFHSLRSYTNRLETLRIDELLSSTGGLPISLVVPAFNEQAVIVESTKSLLTLRYADYEIIVVNDGSSDATLARLTEAFDLVPGRRVATGDLATAPIIGVYHSARHPNLWVIDKVNGGGKADALNAGIRFSRSPLICVMDADTVLESDALARVARPFLQDTTTVGVGGIIRIANGCTIDGGSVEDVRLPRGILPRFQVLEYLRAFLASRVGWDTVGATLIISGAFGTFRRSTVVAVGGFATDTVGEDMELVARLHRHCRERNLPYRITFIPDPVAWTEAPETLSSLGGQRNRWQRGLAQVLVRHRRMVGNPRYGALGLLAFPYYVVFELFGPILEVLGYVAFITAVVLGVASLHYVIAFLALAIFLGSALSVLAVALEELSFRRYRRFRDLATLLGLALVESFGYRQLSTYWRLQGMISAVRGDDAWGPMERTGFSDASDADRQSVVSS